MDLNKNWFKTKTTNTQGGVSMKEATMSISGKTTTPDRNYQEWGHFQAGQADGKSGPMSNSLPSCLHWLCSQVRKEVKEDKVEQDRRKTEARNKIPNLEAEKEILENKIKREKEKLEHEEGKIEKLKKEIEDWALRPKEMLKSLGKDVFDKATFWIGGIIVLLLTIYLFIFYSSAAYSAFFKNFTADDTNIVNSIFDAQAFAKAYSDGATELIFILAIPSVFLGLGFLLHKWLEQKDIKKYFKIAGIIVVTFVFDFIIAYEIIEKIYGIARGGAFKEMPDMTIGMSVQQINFWLIIFAGFVVYIIWGFVFDVVMKEYQKFDAVKYAIKTRQEKILEYKVECKRIKDEIQKMENIMAPIDATLRRLKNEINEIILFVGDFDGPIGEFFAGWLAYMQSAGKLTSEINDCAAIKDKFVLDMHKNASDTNISH